MQMSLQPQGIINFGACNTGTSSTIDLQVTISAIESLIIVLLRYSLLYSIFNSPVSFTGVE